MSLIYVLVGVSATVSFNQHNRTIWSSSPIYCLIRRFVDTSIYGSISIFLVWASFERHILVFHPILISKRGKKVLVHYIWDYKSSACGTGCYRHNPIIPTYKYVIHGFLSISLIVVLNISIFVRVILQKVRVHHPVQWKKFSFS